MEINTSDDLLQCIADALQQERMQSARQAALAEIEERLDTGAVAGFVEQFLLKQWLEVLAQAHVSDQTERIATCLQDLDDLVWSITPKTNAQQRSELIARLPAILGNVNRSLDEIGWQGPERQQFFAQLAERQAVLARAAISPRRKIEYAVTMAQKASERLMSKQAANRAIRPSQSDDVWRTVNARRQGQWLDFQFTPYSAEPMLRYKLAWISPGHTRFIFVQQNGQDFFSISASDLCKAMREREARCVWLHEMPQNTPRETHDEDGG